jgi:purine-cytosine permease-like protein
MMKFLYCRECGNIRPRGWMFMIKRCEICRSDMVKISVKMTKVTPVYYASLAATSVLLVLFLAEYPLPFDTYLVLAGAIVTMIIAFVDYNISYGRAKKMVEGDEEKRKKSE